MVLSTRSRSRRKEENKMQSGNPKQAQSSGDEVFKRPLNISRSRSQGPV